MYNSCTFNSVKFNSLCFVAEVIIKENNGGIRDRRKHKVKIRQFFDILGIKLIFNSQLFNLFGFILLAQKYEIPITAQVLQALEKDLELIGTKQIRINLQKDLIGFTKFLKAEKIDIKAFKLFLSKQGHELHGVKLCNLICYKALKGSKQIRIKDENLIYGEKDICNILEALDLLDLDE